VPPNTPIPVEEGGLTFKSLSPADLAADLDVEDAANAISGKAATHSVRGLAFDNVGNLYVADEGADRVTIFDTGGIERVVLRPRDDAAVRSRSSSHQEVTATRSQASSILAVTATKAYLSMTSRVL
jgi:DNA-binding beta-propeller fold protein YncE